MIDAALLDHHAHAFVLREIEPVDVPAGGQSLPFGRGACLEDGDFLCDT
jgi:hypothetical protein